MGLTEIDCEEGCLVKLVYGLVQWRQIAPDVKPSGYRCVGVLFLRVTCKELWADEASPAAGAPKCLKTRACGSLHASDEFVSALDIKD
jgi:hypothetical protein